MSYKLTHSQNFLRNTDLVKRLIQESSITKEDIVLEIGPGKGIITGLLAQYAKSVIAIEVDQKLSEELKTKFKSFNNIKIYNENFLISRLPQNEYKIFSNIPFTITADIVHKITDSATSPPDSYLIMQSAAAQKYAGMPYGKETLFSILHKPWFKFSILHKFQRTDFIPVPQVDTVLLRIEKTKNSLINPKCSTLYKDFISYGFTSFKPTLKKGYEKVFSHSQFLNLAQKLHFNINAKPTDLTFEQWLGIFSYFAVSVAEKYQLQVKDSLKKLKQQQSNLQKIHRTRTANHWNKDVLI
jgi:23S rRNA (adenine-N6)-dimethyltransferase